MFNVFMVIGGWKNSFQEEKTLVLIHIDPHKYTPMYHICIWETCDIKWDSPLITFSECSPISWPQEPLHGKHTFLRFVNIRGSDGILCIHLNNNFVKLCQKQQYLDINNCFCQQTTKKIELSTPFPKAWGALHWRELSKKWLHCHFSSVAPDRANWAEKNQALVSWNQRTK